MLPPTSTHDLLAATLHITAIAGWQRGLGIRPMDYDPEKHYPMWQEQVEAILEVFPSLIQSDPDLADDDEPARHTHMQYAVMTPDGCLDRNTIRPKEVSSWLSVAENVNAEALSSRIAKMVKVGFKLTRVKVSRIKQI